MGPILLRFGCGSLYQVLQSDRLVEILRCARVTKETVQRCSCGGNHLEWIYAISDKPSNYVYRAGSFCRLLFSAMLNPFRSRG